MLRSDRALLDNFRKGDPAALSKVYWEYVDAVTAVVRHGFIIDHSGRVRGELDAADQRDVVQEVFTRAFSEKARLAYDGLNPYRPYLLRICKNLMIDRARARSRVVALEEQDRSGRPIDEWLADDKLPDEPNLDTDPEWRALVNVTQAFVQTLDDETKRFVKLRYEEQKSQYEVADEMGITRRRVRTLEDRVEKGLKKAVAAKGLKPQAALLVVFIAATTLTAAAPPPRRDFFAESQRAQTEGNVANAWVLLRNVPENHPDANKAREQLKKLLPQIQALSQRLMEKADEAMQDGMVQKSVRILNDVNTRLAPLGQARSDLLSKLKDAEEKLAKLRAEYDYKRQSALERLAKGDHAEAYRQLVRAAELADDQDFPWTFEDEQRLELARLQTPPEKRLASQTREAKRRTARAVAQPSAESIVAQIDSVAQQSDAQQKSKNVRDLISKGRELQKQGKVYEAIVTLTEALTLDPGSVAVKSALDGLRNERARLVEEYLEVGDRAFANQEIEKAAPYFRRVLRLEPDNLRAKESLAMYENFLKIRGVKK